MSPDKLFTTLLEHSSVDQAALQTVLDSLPANASVDTFRKAIVENKLMTLTEVMKIHLTVSLLPASKALLSKLEGQRKNKVHHKPTVHKRKFLVSEDDTLQDQLVFADSDFGVKIPEIPLNQMTFQQSDEKQAVMLAIDLAKMGELTECETILIETIEAFENSLPAIQCLCWFYLSTGHLDEVEVWAQRYFKKAKSGRQIDELSALAYQAQNKHLLATAVYQKLIRLKQVKSLWYLLLAHSQERSLCITEARENYQIYTSIGKNDELKEIAMNHLTKLRSA